MAPPMMPLREEEVSERRAGLSASGVQESPEEHGTAAPEAIGSKTDAERACKRDVNESSEVEDRIEVALTEQGSDLEASDDGSLFSRRGLVEIGDKRPLYHLRVRRVDQRDDTSR
jgi:hypothetical protein